MPAPGTVLALCIFLPFWSGWQVMRLGLGDRGWGSGHIISFSFICANEVRCHPHPLLAPTPDRRVCEPWSVWAGVGYQLAGGRLVLIHKVVTLCPSVLLPSAHSLGSSRPSSDAGNLDRGRAWGGRPSQWL